MGSGGTLWLISRNPTFPRAGLLDNSLPFLRFSHRTVSHPSFTPLFVSDLHMALHSSLSSGTRP